MATKKQLWFKRKSYGWGWTPVTWQGWALVGMYIVLLTSEFARITAVANSVGDEIGSVLPEFVFLTFLLIIICYIRGEKPRWQWAGKPTK